MNLQTAYDLIQRAARLDETRANDIVRSAQPHAEAALRALPDGGLQVSAKLVAPDVARGGSLIPAWPLRGEDGRVTIEFVEDWGAMLAAWVAAAGDDPATTATLVELVGSGDRQWVGIGNDVLQLYVPDPPAGTYSMIRHHALMLVAATLWLGEDRASRWLAAHSVVARAFLGGLNGTPLWDAIVAAERALPALLADTRAHGTAAEVIGWLDQDAASASAFRTYVGAASLGLAALLATAPEHAKAAAWVQTLVHDEHPHPDFNRDRIEAFARRG